jgi:hypothetical protein
VETVLEIAIKIVLYMKGINAFSMKLFYNWRIKGINDLRQILRQDLITCYALNFQFQKARILIKSYRSGTIKNIA